MFEKEPPQQILWCIIRLLPTALFLLVTVGLCACYVWDRYEVEDGERAFPMISHMGAYPPQSCFFTLILCLAAFFMFLIVVIQHRLILLNLLNKPEVQCDTGSSCWDKLKSKFNMVNDVSFLVGVLCSFFLSVVGSFQTQNLSVWHRAGFISFIVLGVLYLVLLCGLTFRSDPCWLNWGRIALTISLFLTLIAFGCFKKVAYSQWDCKEKDPLEEDCKHSQWKLTDGGYGPYKVAAVIELVAMVLFLVMILSLQFDFWHPLDYIRAPKTVNGQNGNNGIAGDGNEADAASLLLEQSVDPMESQKRFDIEDSREDPRRSPYPVSDMDTPLDTPASRRRLCETPIVYSPVCNYRKVELSDAEDMVSITM